MIEEHHLRREFRFKNFREALNFVNRVGEVAEEQEHHPDIDFGWGLAKVTIFTHKIDGLGAFTVQLILNNGADEYVLRPTAEDSDVLVDMLEQTGTLYFDTERGVLVFGDLSV